ncbi:MAG: hypothetical protein KBB55_04315 [Candidatus Buchananbacteria bacterium]|nr:hypothetical protein [Candidatus Buchananbacteria bacterium]
MALTQKQLSVALEHATRHLATKEDIEKIVNDRVGKSEDRLYKTLNDKIERSEDRLAIVMANSFQNVYERLDRLEAIIEKWPPPSFIWSLGDRVGRIEKVLKLKPGTTR